MKFSLLITLILLTGCSGGTSQAKKKSPAVTSNLTFNGFAIGTPLDTLALRIATRPTLRTDDELVYENATAEGVRWNRITYSFVRGKLARVSAEQSGANVSSYPTLYQSLTKRFGTPAQNIDSLTIWAGRDAEFSLQPGNILFSWR